MKKFMLVFFLTIYLAQITSAQNVKEFTINSKHYYENTVNVLAPGQNPACPNGKIIVMTGQSRKDKRIIISDLLTNDKKINTAKGNSITLNTNPSIEKLATDNQIIRMNDGSLLAFKLGFLWSSLNPKPFWWNWYKSDSSNYEPGTRDAVFIYKSTDCGLTWNIISKIDAATIDEGQYGIPKMEDEDEDEKQDEDDEGVKLWHSNGFDRQEVYYDNITDKIYLSTQIASGKYTKSNGTKVPAIDQYGVFVSHDRGITWQLVKETDKRMLVMTTTPNGRFFMFTVSKGIPILFYTTELNDFDLSSIHSVALIPPLPNMKKSEIDTFIHQKNKLKTISIARGDDNTVYLAYPVLNVNGRAEYVIVHVKINEKDPGIFLPSNCSYNTIKSSYPAVHSLSYGTFVESGAQGLNFNFNTNKTVAPKTLFFYIESSVSHIIQGGNKIPYTGPKKVAVKGILIDNSTNTWGDKFFISRDANNGERWFEPYSVPKNGGIGHYTKGAYYTYDQKQNYIVQWPEPDGIHVSVISNVALWK